MSSYYLLECETMHCFGKHTSRVGTAESEQEAIDWKNKLTENNKRPPLPKSDPIRSCPVVRCPLKLQTPRISYRKVEKPESAA